MAEKLRIRKLAQRLGKTPEEILAILHKMGELRYRTAADMLSDEVTVRVEQALASIGIVPLAPKKKPPAPTEPPEPPPLPSFAQPRAAGAAPVAGPTALPAAQDRDSVIATAAPGAEPEPAEQPAPPAVGTADPVAVPAPEAAPAPEPEPEPEVEPEPELPPQVQLRLNELQDQVSRLTAALEESQRREVEAHALERIAIDRLAPAELRAHNLQLQLEEQRRELQAQLDLLQQALNRTEAQARAQEVEELAKVMAGRGIESPDEMQRLLTLLLQGEWQRRTLEHLRIVEGERFGRLLKQKVALWCGDPRCKLPDGMLGLPVSPSSRCETCQGKEILRLAERLVLQCRAQKSNIRRITLVGGRESEVSEFMKAVSGRLDIRWVEPGAWRSPEQARAEADETHLTVLWAGSELPHRLAAAYLPLEGVLAVKSAGLTGFLEELTGLLGQ